MQNLATLHNAARISSLCSALKNTQRNMGKSRAKTRQGITNQLSGFFALFGS
jgi:hypothetical protein